MKYLIYILFAVLTVGNLGFFFHGVIRIFDGDHSMTRCLVVALNLVAAIYCFISAFNLRKELEVVD